MRLDTCFFILMCSLSTSNAFRILGIFPIAAKSHFSCNHAIMKSLHAAGHHITMISPFPSEKKIENFTYIDSRFDSFVYVGKSRIQSIRDRKTIGVLNFAFTEERQYCYNVMKLNEIQEALKSPQKLYDIIITELMLTYECYLPIAEKLGIPVMGTVTLHSWKAADHVVGMPNNLAVLPNEHGDTHHINMNFYERIRNIWYQFIVEYIKMKSRAAVEKFHQKYFPENLLHKKEISLVFYNNHPSLIPRSIPPNAVEIGGIHLQPPNPLPKDIQTFVENAPHGVILFTFGSLVKASSLTLEQREAFLAAFASIPQRVIWKYEESIENLPKNIMLQKWLPQRDILEHENVIAFMSHCGQSGVYEAIATGTPVVTIPLFGDQMTNAAYLHWREVGVNLDFDTMTKESVLASLNTIINDTSYHHRMQQLSSAFKDRPMTPQESVVYWTEYIIRYDGAFHLKALGTDMPLYKYLMLDILGVALVVLITVILIGFVMEKKITACIGSRRKLTYNDKKEK